MKNYFIWNNNKALKKMTEHCWRRWGRAIFIQVVLSAIIIFFVDEKVHTFFCPPLPQFIYYYGPRKQGDPPVHISEWTSREIVGTVMGLLVIFLMLYPLMWCCFMGIVFVFLFIGPPHP